MAKEQALVSELHLLCRWTGVENVATVHAPKAELHKIRARIGEAVPVQAAARPSSELPLSLPVTLTGSLTVHITRTLR
jgi:hypothetical protein